jgi:uncharacterized protein (DUF1501 family)
MISRRKFLVRAGAGGGVICVGSLAPRFWAQAVAAAKSESEQPILVVVELDGGNDGLNTIVPYADDVYHRSRPTLGIKTDKVLKLNEHLGMHPAMTGLHKLWEAGQVKIVNNVGYPNPNRSHSRSMDIWRSGNVAVEPTGWLGRSADQHKELSPCYVGDGAIPLAVRQRVGAAMSINSLDDYRLRESAILPTGQHLTGDPVLAQIAARFDSAGVFANRLHAQIPTGLDVTAEIGGSNRGRPALLAKRLAIIRSLIEHKTEFRIYYTGTTGFDTHANQAYRHRELLTEVSDAVAGFLQQLEKSSLGERVVVLVFSEFGRRVAENGQRGTDHGAAAPVLVAGKRVTGGLLGAPPDLANLDAGDVPFRIDYRDLYASLLHQWLGVDPTVILGKRDTNLELVRLP